MNSHEQKRQTTNYIIGFVGSLVLTFTAYILVVNKWASGMALILTISALALIQVLLQLFMFLHLHEDEKKEHRWRTVAMWFMVVALVIIVAGSLWVMHNMNYNMMGMGADQKEDYMLEQRGHGL